MSAGRDAETRRTQDPPEVTCPEPELGDGDGVALSPLELLELLELPELPEPLDLPVLLDLAVLPDLAVRVDLAVLPEDPVLPEDAAVPDEVRWAADSADRATVVACAEPGRVTPMPRAASTLAAPAAAVTDRSRAWLRFRATTAARLERLSPPWWPLPDAGIVVPLCSHAPGPVPVALPDSLAADLLRAL